MRNAPAARRTRRSLFGPYMYGLAVTGLRIAAVAAFLAAAYLLFGIFSGQLGAYSTLRLADKARILSNITLFSNILLISVLLASVLSVLAFWSEETAGYLLALGGVVIYAGIPFLVGSFANTSVLFQGNAAAQTALAAFPRAAWPVFLGGGILIAQDILLRFISALSAKPLLRESLEYGGDAQPEGAKRPVRLALLAKCWEGPFCREFVRVHCPIFLKRQACWRVKSGCYCEEDIINTAMTRMAGAPLTMAPDLKFNFANDPTPRPRRVELTMAQKRERCRNCVIYNEHQREKYRVLIPVVMIGLAAVCFLLSPWLRELLRMGLGGLETLMARFSFGDTSTGISFRLGRPSPTVEWVLIACFMVMIVAKGLETLEWAVFKAKI